MEDPRPPAGPVSVRRALWAAWTPVAWALPPVLMLVRFAGGGGWESLFMLVSLPVWWPALALLGLLPKLILRRRGYASVPVAVGVALAGCVWGLLGFCLSLRGVGDSGSVDSGLAAFAPGATARVQDAIAGVSIAVVPLCYAAAVVCALAAKRRDGAPRAERPLGTLVLLIGIVAVPILIGLVGAGIGRAAMHGARDSAGSQEVDVVDLTPEQGRARQERNWDAAQRELAGARRAIGADGWLLGAPGGIIDEDRRKEPYEYRVRVAWDRIEHGEPVAIGDRLLPLVEAQGWTPVEGEDGWGKQIPSREVLTGEGGSGGPATGVRFHLRNANGYALDLVAAVPGADEHDERPAPPAGSTVVTLELTSGRYWAESRGDADWTGEGSSAEAAHLWGADAPTFAFDEWPELRLVENQPATVQPRYTSSGVGAAPDMMSES